MRHSKTSFSVPSKKISFLPLDDYLLNDASSISAECSFFLLNISEFFYLTSYLGTRGLPFNFAHPSPSLTSNIKPICLPVSLSHTSLHLCTCTYLCLQPLCTKCFHRPDLLKPPKKLKHLTLSSRSIFVIRLIKDQPTTQPILLKEQTALSFAVKQFPCRSENSELCISNFILLNIL